MQLWRISMHAPSTLLSPLLSLAGTRPYRPHMPSPFSAPRTPPRSTFPLTSSGPRPGSPAGWQASQPPAGSAPRGRPRRSRGATKSARTEPGARRLGGARRARQQRPRGCFGRAMEDGRKQVRGEAPQPGWRAQGGSRGWLTVGEGLLGFVAPESPGIVGHCCFLLLNVSFWEILVLCSLFFRVRLELQRIKSFDLAF